MISKIDPGYRPAAQREQVNSNWYPTRCVKLRNIVIVFSKRHNPNTHSHSNPYTIYDQRPRVATNYAIYPSANNDTFIYEQSACSKSDLFSNSELDSPTTTEGFSSAFSPAMSTDSTITLPRTTIGDDDLRMTRTATPAPRVAYPPSGITSTSSVMARTASAGRHIHEVSEDPRSRISLPQARSVPMHPPVPSSGLVDPLLQMAPSFIPEYAASTFSEQEVNERDFIAKRNAELNSTPTASFYSSSAGSGSSSDGDRRRMPSINQTATSSSRDAFTRVASSQPTQAGINFPTRPPESEFNMSRQGNSAGPSVPFPASRGGSPPRVERLPSHLTAEAVLAQNGSQSNYPYNPFPTDTWSREATLNSEHPRSMSNNTSPKNSTQPSDVPSQPHPRSSQGIYATSPSAQQDAVPAFIDHRQDRTAPAAPMERSRSRRISIVGPRPDLSASWPPSEYKDQHNTAPRAVPDARQLDEIAQRRPMDQIPPSTVYSDRRDMANTPPRGGEQPSARETASRAVAGAEYRRDSRTPSPREKDADDHRAPRSSRRDSYAVEVPRPAPDLRSKAQSPNDTREYIKSVPLSSSPTEIEPTSSRYSSQRTIVPPPTTERAPMERTRVRSISFSSSARPVIPPPVSFNGQMAPPPPQPYPGMSDSRHPSDYDRNRNERSVLPRGAEPLHSTTPAEFDRRLDSRPPTSQAYYSQPSAQEYQNRVAQRPAAAISMTSSRAMDRIPSSLQVPHSRVPVPQDTNTRSRTYPDPAYAPPHTEPVRRHSDGDNPYERSSPPRTGPSYEKQTPSILKVMNPSNSPPPMTPVEPIPLPEPHRRNSDGDQSPPLRLPLNGRSSAPLLRSVRWNENLVCPSPIPSSHRRKGWFNRRG